MGSFSNSYNAARRSIRKIWLKELLYFRANHPIFIFVLIAIFVAFYNVWWRVSPDGGNLITNGRSSVQNLRVFDNFRITRHKFVRMMICIPPTVVDYRFSTVTDAIHLTHLDFPDLEFVKELEKGRKKLKSGEIQILVHFTTLIETGKLIEYNIISQEADLNKDYCVHCDERRRKSWGNAIEAQQVVNRFLYWLVKSRGVVDRKPHWQLSNVFVEGFDEDPIYKKRQTDLFIAWIILLPICSRLIDSWNDDRKSGIYKVLHSLKIRRLEYFIAKFQLWYGMSLVISVIVAAANILTMSVAFSITYLPFLVIYVASIITFTIFLATLFPGSPFFAKFVGLLLMCGGEFGFGTVYHGTLFFQLSVRFFGKTADDGYAQDAIALVCMSTNALLVTLVSLYLDTYFFTYTEEALSVYFPLERAFWRPTLRDAIIDENHVKQMLVDKDANEKPLPIPIISPAGVGQEVKVPEVKFPPFITLLGVCKRIANHWRVNKLSLTVRYGEILTLYGHHGCGSEEILGILSGELIPEYGEVKREETQRPLTIATTVDVPCVNYLTPRSYLTMVSNLRGVTLHLQQCDPILAELDLQKVAHISLDLLSSTQKERLRIAAAFVGSPDVVLIAWPTLESLPDWKCMLLRYIEAQKEGRAIVIASYDAAETEAISDRVVMLSEGWVVFNGPWEVYKKSMHSVFEIRVWPVRTFSAGKIKDLVKILTLNDAAIEEASKHFDTPNGKLRVTLPIKFRKCIPMIMQELEKVTEKFKIAFFEVSRPDLHDIYTNACYDASQYAPLKPDNFNKLELEYANQKPTSRGRAFFMNLVRIFKDRQFWYQAAAVFVLFLMLGLFTLVSYQEIRTQYTHRIALDAHDFPISIYCEDCHKERAARVTYHGHIGTNELKENNAYLFWKNDTVKADAELVVVTRGDNTFTMIVQNFAISQMIFKMTGRYPTIRPTLESEKFRSSSAKGFSAIFNDVNKNQAAMILSESYSLLYLLGVFQTFLYTLSALLPLRLVSVRMRPESMLFPWPRPTYFGLIFAANMAVFIVFSAFLTALLVVFGFFATSTVSCFFHFWAVWTIAFLATLPLIYILVFNVNNASAIVPTVMAVSSLLVNLPNMVSSFSAENAVSLQSLLKFVSMVCLFSPPTAVQVLAAFLNSGEFHEQNWGTITALSGFPVVYLFIPICSAVFVVFRPGFDFVKQQWFIYWTSFWSHFDYGTTLKPGARIKNTLVFGQPVTSTSEAKKNSPTTSSNSNGDRKANKDTPLLNSPDGVAPAAAPGAPPPVPRPPAGQEAPVSRIQKMTTGGGGPREVAAEKTRLDMSPITNYEEHLIRKTATMKRWDEKQELPIGNHAMFLLGDQMALKSSLLKAIAETNTNETIAYVPFVECLPTRYTPSELLENVAACHGYTVSEEHIKYLLETFGMWELRDTRIGQLTDADRRILTLLSKLVIKPTIIILDQLDMFLPHPKMMTVWALCSCLRANGVGIIFTTRQNSFAEHTATSCAHMHKGAFLASTLPPSTIKATMHCTVVEVFPRKGESLTMTSKIVQMQLGKDTAMEMPSTGRRIIIKINFDDANTIDEIQKKLKTVWSSLEHYCIRSGNLEEYVADAFQ